MPATNPEVVGYTVTLEVFVPADVAERMVNRLDASWHTESWSPMAAAYVVIREALETAGLDRSANLSSHEVVR